VGFKRYGGTWQVLTNYLCVLGECPVWDAAKERVLWVDVALGEIHQYFPATRQHRVFKAGQVIGSFALCTSGRLIASFQNGFAFVDLETEVIQWLTDPEANEPDNRFNDGKCDPRGRFWAGTMSLTGKKSAGSLYALEAGGGAVLKIPGVSVSNGLAWSPDHTKFYFIDSPTNQITAYDYDIETGNLSNKTTAVTIPPEMGKPDGMTIDTEGMLWVALWNGWSVTQWNPHSGELMEQIKLPVAQVTSCTFGGKELGDLYITTAKLGLSDEELDKQPLAGSVFVIKIIGVKGLPAVSFKD
jgi:sugar lactone lactonase YvrE